jgi:putative tricarboxylic transport membrane protein
MVRGWRLRADQPWLAWDDWVRSPRHIAALAILLGGVVFYIAVSNRLGFLPTAIMLLTALLSVLRVPPLRAIGIAVLAALVIHFAFYKLLRVPLPWGVLTPYAW